MPATSCDGIGVVVASQDADLGEPHAECPTCTNRFVCENVARLNKKSIRHLHDEAHERRERAEREPLVLAAGENDSCPDSLERDSTERGVLETGPGDQEFVRGKENRSRIYGHWFMRNRYRSMRWLPFLPPALGGRPPRTGLCRNLSI